MVSLILRTSICLILALHVYATSTPAQQQTEPPLITVTGQAEVKAPPDEVVFTLGVVKMDKDLVAAKEQNDASVKRIMELTRRYNIAPQDVQTDYISVEPKYSYERKRNSAGDELTETRKVFDGYEVSKTVVIRLKDISRFENLLSDIIKAGVDRLRDLDFRTSSIRRYKDQARALAIKAAQEKAIALTKEIGQTIGKAHTIREEGYSLRESNVTANNTALISGSYSAEDENSTIAPGMISVSARIVVSFRLQ